MRPEVAFRQLRQIAAWEYVVRFAFGGAIATLTGLIARKWGPGIAGLFLAFPAILPASITLVKRHGGRRKATDEARGARIGTLGLFAFAIVVVISAGTLHPVLVLLLATIAWLAVNVGAWFLCYSRPST